LGDDLLQVGRLIDLPAKPQAMEQDGQLASDCDDRSLIGALTSAFGEAQTPAAQIAIGAEGAEDVLGTADQEAAQIVVAGLPGRTPGRCGDSKLRVAVAGLIALRDQAQSGIDLSAFPEGHTCPEPQVLGRDDVRKRPGSSRVRMKARAVSGPTPATRRNARVSG